MSDDPEIDWCKTNLAGGCREQLRRWYAMSLRHRAQRSINSASRPAHWTPPTGAIPTRRPRKNATARSAKSPSPTTPHDSTASK
jgi:hypothetical protein